MADLPLDPARFVDVHVGLVRRMEIEITEASADRVVGRMPVKENTQPFGLLHGGASAVLAETLGSVGANFHSASLPDGVRMALGIELNVSHHRSVSDGHVTGVATPVHLGTTVATYEIVVTDERDRRVCTSRLTCVLKEIPAGQGPTA